MDKVARSAAAAVADVPHGATLLFGGFGVVQGWPNSLLLALRDHGARDLTVIFNTPGVGPLSAQLLAEAGLIRKVIASFAAYPTRPTPIEEQIKAGKIELELVPQGTLAERVRAGGAGIPGFYTPTGVGTLVAEGKERRTFGGREYILETALTADVAFVRARHRAPLRERHPRFRAAGRGSARAGVGYRPLQRERAAREPAAGRVLLRQPLRARDGARRAGHDGRARRLPGLGEGRPRQLERAGEREGRDRGRDGPGRRSGARPGGHLPHDARSRAEARPPLHL